MPTLTRLAPRSGAFWRDLPSAGRLLLSVVVVETLGSGLVLPFNVAYLHEVRGLGLGAVGWLLSAQSLVGLVAVGPVGLLIDRYGARAVLMTTSTLLVVGMAAVGLAPTVPLLVAGLLLAGVGQGALFPTFQALIAAVIPTGMRPRFFGVHFALLNLGIGLGGILGGLFVDVHRPWTFAVIYVADAVTYLPTLMLLLGPLRHLHARVERPPDEPAVGYLALLRRPAVLPLMLVTVAASTVGYSQLNVGLPAYARAVARISTRDLGFAFAANTVVIVLLQLGVLRLIEGRRRTRVLAVMGVVWAAAWALLAGSGALPGTAGAALLVAGSASVFALGETLLQPSLPAIVNDLAPDHLRGRYNALDSLCFQAPMVAGPLLAGSLLGHGLQTAYVVVLVAGSLLVSALAVGVLERALPDAANR